jgi:uncharacterized protein
MRPVSSYRWVGADLELSVHAQPGARRTEAQGVHGDAIKIRVAAPPVEGAANQMLLDFLADAFSVALDRCHLIGGQTSRRKRIRIEAPDRAHADRLLAAWTGPEKT